MSLSSNTHAQSARSGLALYAGIILIGANLRAPITCLGPVLPDIQAALHLNGAGAGLLNALPLLLFALLSLIAPFLGRRHGLERMLGAAMIAILIGTLVRSCPVTGAIWLGTAVLSCGIAIANVLLPGLVKRDFPVRGAGLIGLYAAAMAAMAGLAAGLAVPISALPGSGWRWSLGVWAGLALIAAALWTPQLLRRQHHLAGAPARAAYRSPWRHPIGWQVSLFFALHSLVFYSIVDWFASYAFGSGLPLAASGLYLLVYQVVAVAANLGSASMIRKSSDQKLLGLGCGTLLLAGTLGLLLLPGFSLLWLVCAGLGAGIAMVTSLSLFSLRTRDHHQASALSGMAQFIGYIGAAAGPLLVGILHDATGSWTLPLMLLVAASASVMLFATLAGRQRIID